MKKISFLFCLIVILISLSGCLPGIKNETQPQEDLVASTDVQTDSFTKTPEPVMTPTSTPPIPTEQPTSTSTVEIQPSITPGVVQWLDFRVEFANYTQVSLEFNMQNGAYFGEGLLKNGEIRPFRCSFKMAPSTELVCRGAPLLSGESMNFTLYDAVSGSQVYRNRFSNIGTVPTPMGMSCEVEPQWNNQGHENGQGCFAISCFLNGEIYYGNNNTCEEPWPFDWDYYHPLSPLP